MPTPAGAPRVVLIHGPELLGSEQKAVDRLRGGLARGRNSAALVDASPDEEAVARAWIDHAEPGTSPALPAAWAAAPVVLVLELLPPIGEKPRRRSGGLGAWVAFRPPSTDPVIVQRGQPAGPDLGDEGAVQAVLDTLALAAGATP
ncbi:MAG: hypothetical protein IPL61_17405 [Myxococcales bacterium]|nr:hypothetical protein [Myxococcales bacterium]